MSVSSIAVTEAALLERLHSTLARVEAKTTELQTAIEGKRHWLPAPMQDKIVAGWNKFCDLMQRIWDNVNVMLSSMGAPGQLWDTADAWSDQVGVPVSGQVQAAEAGMLTVDDNWNGAAADAYRQMLPMQKTALDKVKSTITDGLATALKDVAQGIVVFWGGLIGALIALTVGLLGALISTASIVGLPAAPFIGAGAALVASASMITGAEILKGVCSSVNSILRQKFDDTGFYGGQWPRPGTT